MCNTIPQRSTLEERKELLGCLIPQLKKVFSELEIKFEALKYLANLPIGFQVDINEKKEFSFSDPRYLKDIAGMKEIVQLKTQNEVLSFLEYFQKDTHLKKEKRLFFVSLSKDGKKVLWLDHRTQNPSFYLGGVDVYTKPSMVFLVLSILPDGTQMN